MTNASGQTVVKSKPDTRNICIYRCVNIFPRNMLEVNCTHCIVYRFVYRYMGTYTGSGMEVGIESWIETDCD